MKSIPAPISSQVRVWGPDSEIRLDESEAIAYCHQLTGGHYENFSVLSRLVPRDLRDDFAAVYAFCRWSDDLGDEIGDREESRRLLDWWRGELDKCVDGSPGHPVMVALSRTIARHELPRAPFDALIDAFLMDQEVIRYESWDALLDYCALSANPVGRLVLMMLGEPRTDEYFGPSDSICTALQLTNHWQDVGRDLLERDRIYIPGELIDHPRFESELRRSAEQGWASDPSFLEASRRTIRTCVDRTWPLYEAGDALLDRLSPHSRPLVGLFRDGGMRVLRMVEVWNHETVLHRPKLGRGRKFMLLARAVISARLASGRGGGVR